MVADRAHVRHIGQPAEGREAGLAPDSWNAFSQHLCFYGSLLPPVLALEAPEGSHVDTAVAERLRYCVEPLLASGDAMRPDFGDTGSLLAPTLSADQLGPIDLQIDFDARSVREGVDGSPGAAQATPWASTPGT
jgi:hypothetical protein